MRVSDERERRAFFHFCPDCGATVFYTTEASPGVVAIPVGALADPGLKRRRGHAPVVTGRACRLVSASLEHDLATLPAGRDSFERCPGLRERKDRVDLRAKLACVHER